MPSNSGLESRMASQAALVNFEHRSEKHSACVHVSFFLFGLVTTSLRSLITKRRQRIGFGGAPRRDVTSEQRNGEQPDRHHRKGGRISGGYFE